MISIPYLFISRWHIQQSIYITFESAHKIIKYKRSKVFQLLIQIVYGFLFEMKYQNDIIIIELEKQPEKQRYSANTFNMKMAGYM